MRDLLGEERGLDFQRILFTFFSFAWENFCHLTETFSLILSIKKEMESQKDWNNSVQDNTSEDEILARSFNLIEMLCTIQNIAL